MALQSWTELNVNPFYHTSVLMWSYDTRWRSVMHQWDCKWPMLPCKPLESDAATAKNVNLILWLLWLIFPLQTLCSPPVVLSRVSTMLFVCISVNPSAPIISSVIIWVPNHRHDCKYMVYAPASQWFPFFSDKQTCTKLTFYVISLPVPPTHTHLWKKCV